MLNAALSITIHTPVYGEAAPSALFSGAGVVNGRAIPGQQANVTATISDGTTVTGYAWRGYTDAADLVGTPLGTAANPADYSAYERLEVTLTGAGGPYVREIPVQQSILIDGAQLIDGGQLIDGLM